MTTIKIISNPYEKKIEFDLFNDASGEWEMINLQNNPGSKLITEEIKTSFFPYKMKDIINTIQTEYHIEGDRLKLVFEGTDDEFAELVEVCSDFEGIELERSNVMIENARDILPQIIEIFSKIKPIVDNSITDNEVKKSIDKDIEKFTDASNDIVPICVLGNYSSGKSTFVNALIGKEILPSGDMPVTAKIYRIKQSLDNKACVAFFFNDYRIVVNFSEEGATVQSSEENELASRIERKLKEIESATMSEQVNCCLETINDQRKGVSDLIDIEIPFAEGPLKNSKNSFVIFDTPGSNTATYKEHFVILEDAMNNLSNGIPIYVAEFNSLDSCDNESLYQKVKEIAQIDDRFTMIVVNKADSANIKEKEFDEDMQETILSQAVPRNLYSGGIYFVSSIMGLGSKTEGVFTDEHAEEFFEDNERKYSNPDSKRYKVLYRYNIMPEQIKKNITAVSEKEENLIFANSGLLAIEHELVNFAEKYSAYDKCQQSNRYISNITRVTQEEIEEMREYRQAKKEQLEKEMDADKKALIISMEEKSIVLFDEYRASYDEGMKFDYERVRFSYSNEEMKDVENEILLKKKDDHNYSEKANDLRESGVAILDNFADLGEKAILEVVKGLGEDIKTTWSNVQELRETKVDADRDTVEELLNRMKADYNVRMQKAVEHIDASSRHYWQTKAEELKHALAYIVTHSDTLDDDKKKELSDVILAYGSISFKNEHDFAQADFEKKIWLFGRLIYLNKINIRKLTEAYNTDYAREVTASYNYLKSSHEICFDIWLKKLESTIRENIVDYSPQLSKQAKMIDEETRLIQGLQQTKSILEAYSDQITSLMDWKVFG